MPTAAAMPVSEHLKKIPEAVRSTVRAARRTVRAVLPPKATEIPYRISATRTGRSMWKIARYAVDDTNVVGIGTFTKHASIFFYRGRELDDGSGLLEGSGKDLRYITLRTPADAVRPAVKRLVRKAFALTGAPTRASKR